MINMIRGEVQADRTEGTHRRDEGQLGCTDLHRHDVDVLMHDHIDQGGPDIARCRDPQIGRAQHRGKHQGGRGLAVRPRHGKPRRERPVAVRPAQPPGEFQFAPHGDSPPLRDLNERSMRRQARRYDEQIGIRDMCRLTEMHRRAQSLQDRTAFLLGRTIDAVDDAHLRPQLHQRISCGVAGNADARDNDVPAREITFSIQGADRHGVADGPGHARTHSA